MTVGFGDPLFHSVLPSFTSSFLLFLSPLTVQPSKNSSRIFFAFHWHHFSGQSQSTQVLSLLLTGIANGREGEKRKESKHCRFASFLLPFPCPIIMFLLLLHLIPIRHTISHFLHGNISLVFITSRFSIFSQLSCDPLLVMQLFLFNSQYPSNSPLSCFGRRRLSIMRIIYWPYPIQSSFVTQGPSYISQFPMTRLGIKEGSMSH